MNTARIKQVEEVSEISAITYGFMASKALFAHQVRRVYPHCQRRGSLPDAHGEATGIAKNRLVTLLTALKSLDSSPSVMGISQMRRQRHVIWLRAQRGNFRPHVSLRFCPRNAK